MHFLQCIWIIGNDLCISWRIPYTKATISCHHGGFRHIWYHLRSPACNRMASNQSELGVLHPLLERNVQTMASVLGGMQPAQPFMRASAVKNSREPKICAVPRESRRDY